jgi:hypothetical protein
MPGSLVPVETKVMGAADYFIIHIISGIFLKVGSPKDSEVLPTTSQMLYVSYALLPGPISHSLERHDQPQPALWCL